MSEVEYIIGIYNNFNPFPEDPEQMGYYFLFLLDQKGLLDLETAKNAYLEKSGLSTNSEALNLNLIGPFGSTEILNQYAFLLCEKLNAEKVSLLSVQDYNALLESSQSIEYFQRDLLEKGNVLQNIERKKKGLLSRFFQ